MTDQELLGALGRLGKDVVDTPICAGCRYKDDCDEKDCAIVRAAVERVADTGWRDASVEVPTHDGAVLVTVNGQYGHLEFKAEVELAHYYDGEGWILETCPRWLGPQVTHWRELPEGPETGGGGNGGV